MAIGKLLKSLGGQRMQLALAILVAAFGFSSVGYGIYWQHAKAASLAKLSTALSDEAKLLSGQLASANTASNISTSTWKSYCDPHSRFCFSYPADWTLQEDYNEVPAIGTATLTNPTKTISVTFMDSYIKDDFGANFIVRSMRSLKLGSDTLGIAGGYYVAAVRRVPQYSVVNLGTKADEPSLSVKPGTNVFIGGAPVFTYGDTGEAEFVARPSAGDFLTTTQAEAWLNSPDGKTAEAVISSLHLK